MSQGKTLCFTGQRPKDLCPTAPDKYSARPYKKFVNDLTLYLDDMYKAGYRNFISGGAQGFDQLAFWAVAKLKKAHPDVQNIAYLPFKGQEGAWVDDTGLFTPTNYRKMLKLADKVVWTSEHQGIQVDTQTGYGINQALNMRNHAMVDDSDIVVALYRDPRGVDMTKKSGSGTNNCMRYAMERGVPIYQIVYDNDATGALAPRRDINVMIPEVPRAEKTIPMWMQPEQKTGRTMSDINAAYDGLQQPDEEQFSTSYGVDF